MLGGQCEAGYSCAYMNTVSWQSPTTPLPIENNPSVVFDRLFGEGGTPEERLERMKKKRSLLDRVNQDLARLQKSLGSADRVRITEYFDAVREVERRIQTAEEQNSNSTLPVPDRPIGIPSRFDDHLKLLYDLQWLAYQGDLTRVFTLMYGRELNSRSFSGDRHLRAASWPVAPRRQAGADREVLEAEHVPGRVVCLLPGETSLDAGW